MQEIMAQREQAKLEQTVQAKMKEIMAEREQAKLEQMAAVAVEKE